MLPPSRAAVDSPIPFIQCSSSYVPNLAPEPLLPGLCVLLKRPHLSSSASARLVQRDPHSRSSCAHLDPDLDSGLLGSPGPITPHSFGNHPCDPTCWVSTDVSSFQWLEAENGFFGIMNYCCRFRSKHKHPGTFFVSRSISVSPASQREKESWFRGRSPCCRR